MIEIQFNHIQISAIDWALKVAINTVAAQTGDSIPHKEAHDIVNGLTLVNEYIEDQLDKQGERRPSPLDVVWRQDTIF